MKLLAFSGSNSSTSINQSLVTSVASMARENHEVDVIQLTKYNYPLYGIDLEKAEGIPATIQSLLSEFSEYDGFIISTPEHNSTIPVFFKNVLDWMSRMEGKPLEGKKVALLSCSPGRGGAAKSLAFAEKVIPYLGAEIVGTQSFSSFGENFNDGEILNLELKNDISNLLAKLV